MWKPKFHCPVHSSPPLASIQSTPSHNLFGGIVVLQTILQHVTDPRICHLSHVPLFFLSELRIIISSYLHSYRSKQDFTSPLVAKMDPSKLFAGTPDLAYSPSKCTILKPYKFLPPNQPQYFRINLISPA